MLLYGCEVPGKLEEGDPRTVWDCGSTDGPKSDLFSSAPVCSSGMRILYSWSKDAPALQLPAGVGFKIGKGTGVNYVVLKVYYADVSKMLSGGSDNSGITITVLPSTTNKITKKAGLYLLSTGGVIRSGTGEHFECACTIDEPVHMHPFAFRPHSHALGKAVSAYKIDKDGNWVLIGKGTPRKPMKFYPVKNTSLVINDGDIVASRCTMYNFRDRDTHIGPTDHDEMCMFYMMYYVDGDQPLDQTGGCSSSGPPTYYWSKDPKLSVPAYIDKEASDPEY
ncbi:Peptidylglycine alpha-hydroxylating monooxygenase [Araneus ventricosus]|uniref:peptidylglycine monooxygenase n=1 Tax=Araneus ventricosus TaxID=182803 RepID=A0A4Y2I3L9_ARAVE|nr:Peptidylglycine alpha-hydroxylating monooxygenase [Araneus ventricosus]